MLKMMTKIISYSCEVIFFREGFGHNNNVFLTEYLDVEHALPLLAQLLLDDLGDAAADHGGDDAHQALETRGAQGDEDEHVFGLLLERVAVGRVVDQPQSEQLDADHRCDQ